MIHRSRVVFIVFFLLAIFALGWQLGMQTERKMTEQERLSMEQRFVQSGSGVTFRDDPEQEVDLSLLWTVWRLLDQYYVDPDTLTIDTLRHGAIRGLVNAVGDPYTSYMTPKENDDFKKVLQGTLEGIGAELTLRDERIVVVAPIKGSPASRAGLQPLDIILTVDGYELDGVSLEDAVDRIRGQKGSAVELKIFRPEVLEELTFSIVRDKILVPSVDHEVIEHEGGTIGYLEIVQFGDSTAQEARAGLKNLLRSDLDGIILDLRFNGGGYLQGAVEIASLFLKSGKIVSVHHRGEEVDSEYVLGNPLDTEVPMVILINEGTASSSEIVAGALRDHGRAILIGAQSFGKGTVQDVIDLPGNSSLRVTIAKWKTPSDHEFDTHGIEPDIAVPMTREDYEADRDPQRDAAVRYLLTGSAEEEVIEEER